MKKALVALFAVVAMLSTVVIIGSAYAGECTGNEWQPTFVRHNSVAPTVYYYNGTTFIPMATPDEALRTCRAYGVRMLITGQNCFQRNWGDFGCGCNITPSPNTTCAAFQDFLIRSGRLRP